MRLGGSRHGFIDQIVYTKGCLHRGGAKRLGDLIFDGFFGSRFVQRHGAAQKIIGIQVAQYQIRIGHRGVFTSAAIAGRPGVGTAAFRSHLQKAHVAHFGDTAATGPDFH